jgi:hypothetical protein
VNLDQDLILAQPRVWHLAGPHAIGASIRSTMNAFIDVVSRLLSEAIDKGAPSSTVSFRGSRSGRDRGDLSL